MSYDAIVLDNDGILTERTDEAVLYRAIRAAFEAFDVPDPPDDHVRALHRVRLDDVERICALHDLDPEPFWRRRDDEAARRQMAAIRRGEKPPYYDVDAIFDTDTPIGVVSNNQHETVGFLLEYFDLADSVETVYGREHTIDGLRRKKPNPHYLRQALADLDAEDALYVGDSQKDVVAADRLGIDSAFVRRPHRTDLTLDPEPTVEVSDLRELRELLDAGAIKATQ